MNKCFNDQEINILWDMFIDDYPGASRSTKSQVVKKWKTGTYANTVNANAIVVKYFNELEQKEKVDKEWEKLDEVAKEQSEEWENIWASQKRVLSEQATIDRNKINHEKTKESNDQLRKVVQMMKSQLIEEMGDFQYNAWVDSHFNREYKSSFGL
jgi:transketolase